MVIFDGKTDVFGGITIYSYKYGQLKDLKQSLHDSLDIWRKNAIRGVWFHVDIKDSWWIPVLVEEGFIFHHAQSNYVMLTKWLPEQEENTLPKYPFTSIGVAGLVVNNAGEVLLMKERRGNYLGWKYPGGAADPQEDIFDAGVREVFEETGVQTEPVCLLCFRHFHGFRFQNNSDLYFVCVMKPVDENHIEVKPCPHETSACRWMSREDIAKLPSEEFHKFHISILERYDQWLESGRIGCHAEKFEIPEIKKRWMMYYID
uniref:Nudix hydrolase domain-containing protein n=1 Tax=Parascaris univalens TaxID=6257 RepID=A0A914ZDV3_PARUN